MGNMKKGGKAQTAYQRNMKKINDEIKKNR